MINIMKIYKVDKRIKIFLTDHCSKRKKNL